MGAGARVNWRRRVVNRGHCAKCPFSPFLDGLLVEGELGGIEPGNIFSVIFGCR